MVSLKSVSVSLRSQYGYLFVPEYVLPPSVSSLRSSSASTTVYVPIYDRSQFWICYTIAPPHPPATYFYFKLFIDGAHVVSWGCGQEEEYEGTTSFALFEKQQVRRPGSTNAIERRGFFFPSDSEQNAEMNEGTTHGKTSSMEIKVYRANARRRVVPAYQTFQSTPAAWNREESIDLRAVGKLRRTNPQRFYQYALLDPLDQPFTLFRYIYRTWAELRELATSHGMMKICPLTSRRLGNGPPPMVENELSKPLKSPTLRHSRLVETEKKDTTRENKRNISASSLASGFSSQKLTALLPTIDIKGKGRAGNSENARVLMKKRASAWPDFVAANSGFK